ncbi:MAG TPA: hypothetical protein VM163_04995 [bacterium]|nr:hypothetical protein [bacterium]
MWCFFMAAMRALPERFEWSAPGSSSSSSLMNSAFARAMETPFVSGVHLDSGFFLPRTKVLEHLVRDDLPSGSVLCAEPLGQSWSLPP